MKLLETSYKRGATVLHCTYYAERSTNSDYCLPNGRKTTVVYAVYQLPDREDLEHARHYSHSLSLADCRSIVDHWSRLHGKQIGKQGFRRVR